MGREDDAAEEGKHVELGTVCNAAARSRCWRTACRMSPQGYEAAHFCCYIGAMDDERLDSVIMRAQEAILRAKTLTAQIARGEQPVASQAHGGAMPTPSVAEENRATHAPHREGPQDLETLVASLIAPRSPPWASAPIDSSSSHPSSASLSEEGHLAAQRLRLFLSLQLRTSQTILQQLQQQQQRADELAARLALLSFPNIHPPPHAHPDTSPMQSGLTGPHAGGDASADTGHTGSAHAAVSGTPATAEPWPWVPPAAGGTTVASEPDDATASLPSRPQQGGTVGADTGGGWWVQQQRQQQQADAGLGSWRHAGRSWRRAFGGIGRFGARELVQQPQEQRQVRQRGDDGQGLQREQDQPQQQQQGHSGQDEAQQRQSGQEEEHRQQHPHPADGDEGPPEVAAHVSDPDDAPTSPSGPGPLHVVAARLALLQEQQSNTLQQLLNLRLEQLRLRQQQLSALQELLRAEAGAVEGTALQLSAVQQALQLLAQSLDDTQLASAAIHAGRGTQDVAALAVIVSRADSRAEHVSDMARQLLGVLREFPRRDGDGARAGAAPGRRGVEAGATEEELEALPSAICCAAEPEPSVPGPGTEPALGRSASHHSSVSGEDPDASNSSSSGCDADGHDTPDGVASCAAPMRLAIAGDACGICLSEFLVGEVVRSADGTHYFHRACLWEWLRIRAACPTCRLPLRRGQLEGMRAEAEAGVGQEQELGQGLEQEQGQQAEGGGFGHVGEQEAGGEVHGAGQLEQQEDELHQQGQQQGLDAGGV